MSDAAGPPASAGPSGGRGSARPPWLPFAIGAVVLLVVVALVFVFVGGDDDEDAAEVDTGAGTSNTTATITSETTEPADDATVPPTSPTTDTTVPGELIDCGSITPSGWPTTTPPNPAVMNCLVDAFEAGTPATLLEVSYGASDGGGDPAYRHEIRYEVIGTRLLRVTTDWATATAPDAPDAVTVEECTELSADTMWPAPDSCTVVS